MLHFKDDIFTKLDINNVLFNGDLFKDVYMSILFGFVGKKENRVCKMHKSIYGIKQASHQWFINLSSALKSNMFHQSCFNYSLFAQNYPSNIITLLVYIDNVILAGNNLEDIKSTKKSL